MKLRLSPALLLALLPACDQPTDGLPVGTYSDFLESMIVARCERAISCNFIPASDRTSCEEFLRGFANPTLTLDGLTDGRSVYDAAAAERCLATIAAEPCIRTPDILPVNPSVCPGVLVPQVAPGGSCQSQLGECPADYQCTGSERCSTTCRAAPTDGQPCNLSACASGHYCDYTVLPSALPVCRQRIAQGGSCSGRNFGECRDGLVCIGDPGTWAGTCQAPAGQGEPCFSPKNLPYPARASCQPGLVCNYLLATPVCQPPARSGDSCGSPDDCEEGLQCIGYQFAPDPFSDPPTLLVTPGRCGPPPAEGAACATPSDCPWQHGCVGGLCRRLPRLGEPCADGPIPCSSGYCEPRTRTCEPRLPLGATCEPAGPSEQCSGSMTQCDPTTARCVSTLLVCENPA